MGQGAVRMSARGLWEEIKDSEAGIRETIQNNRKSAGTLLMEKMPEEVLKKTE